MDIKLDKKDKEVIHQLQLNSRQSFSELAKKLRLSKEVVRYRVKRLEDVGVISRYTMMLNARKAGQESFRWYLQLENTNKEKLMEIITGLQNHSYCIWVGTCTGRWDLIAVFSAYSPRHFESITSELLAKYHANIRENQFVIALDVYFFKTGFFGKYEFEFSKTPYWGGEDPILKLDKTELKILKELCIYPRISIADIARKYGVSFQIVRNRIQHLEKTGFIQEYSVLINYPLLGLETYKVFFDMKRTTKEKEREFLTYLSYHKNVAETIHCLGNWNMEVNFVVKNSNEYHEAMMELKDRFPGLIKSYISTQVFTNYKYNLFPMADEMLKALKH